MKIKHILGLLAIVIGLATTAQAYGPMDILDNTPGSNVKKVWMGFTCKQIINNCDYPIGIPTWPDGATKSFFLHPPACVDIFDCPVCGNGTVERGEQCDDGNTTNDNNGCDSSCQFTIRTSSCSTLPAGAARRPGDSVYNQTCTAWSSSCTARTPVYSTVYSTSDTTPACEYTCAAGSTRNGTSCNASCIAGSESTTAGFHTVFPGNAPDTYATCTLSYPALVHGGTTYPNPTCTSTTDMAGDDINGTATVTNSFTCTDGTITSGTPTASIVCDAGYTFDGHYCVQNTYACSSAPLSAVCSSCNTAAYIIGSNITTVNPDPWTYVTSTPSVCEYTCAAGYIQGAYMSDGRYECNYDYASCTTPWGTTISHGSSVTAYQSSSVACGSSCVSETRTCNDGTLGGSYTNQSCSVQSCSSSSGGGSSGGGTSCTVHDYEAGTNETVPDGQGVWMGLGYYQYTYSVVINGVVYPYDNTNIRLKFRCVDMYGNPTNNYCCGQKLYAQCDNGTIVYQASYDAGGTAVGGGVQQGGATAAQSHPDFTSTPTPFKNPDINGDSLILGKCDY